MLGALAAACSSVTPKRNAATSTPTRSRQPTGVREIDGLAVAEWLVEENARADHTAKWIIPRRDPSAPQADIAGYVDKVSANRGEELTLYVDTTAATFQAFVYRIGYYSGDGGRRLAASPLLPGVHQPPPTFVPGINMIECHWTPSWKIRIGSDWPPGYYLIRLEASPGEQQYVPFIVRDDSSNATYVVQSSVTTWQAYNPYGGYSLYGGTPIGNASEFESRSRIVSFDRPYSHLPTALDARGSGDFLGNELPFVYFAERHGLDLTYWTDVDLDARPHLLAKHRCLISLGHDEYWSMAMRTGVEDAIVKGTNLAILGANACYRQIRFQDSNLGSRRRVICYKDAASDPIVATDPALATGGSWATDPIRLPESEFIGLMYQSFGGAGPLVVADGTSWVYRGTGLSTGDTIAGIIGSEFDAFEPGLPHPGGLTILAHSPTGSQSGRGFSDMSYYANHGQGGVFASGTASWVSAMWDGAPRTAKLLGFGVEPDQAAAVSTITSNVLGLFGRGAAGDLRPSTANWRRFYSPNSIGLQAKDVS